MSEINETEKTAQVSVGAEVSTMLKKNLRDYMMYIVLIAIIIFFTAMTGGKFLTATNISNLFNQAAYVAVLAIGMTVILILRQIDLSVGYVAGFSGAVCGILLSNHGWPVFAVIPLVLLLGIAIGFYQGTLVTRVGVPAFVTTLAGMFIFRGLLGVSTSASGTIVIKNDIFNTLNNGFIPDFGITENFHLVTFLIGIVAVILVIVSQIKVRKNNMKYNFKVSSTPVFVTKMVLISAVVMVIITTLAKANGIPWSAVIVAVVLLIYNYVLNKTKLGRYVYGIGGNDQAAELSGVNVRRVTMIAFCAMSCLAALAGILYTSRLQSATPTAGNAFEMDAIASSYIGGVAVSGGVGKVTNTIIGTLVIMSLTNGMNLLMVDTFMQYVVKGIIFIIAVAFDVTTRKKNG